MLQGEKLLDSRRIASREISPSQFRVFFTTKGTAFVLCQRQGTVTYGGILYDARKSVKNHMGQFLEFRKTESFPHSTIYSDLSIASYTSQSVWDEDIIVECVIRNSLEESWMESLLIPHTLSGHNGAEIHSNN